MLNFFLPIGWILLLLEETSGKSTCSDGAGNIIVIDLIGA